VISVQQLEPAPDPTKPDDFQRLIPQNPELIKISGKYKIERIYKKRINKSNIPEYEVI
jgi:hypothetical protein